MALYAFDGTWNRQHDQASYDENSNVVRFAKAYQDSKATYQKDGDAEHVVEDTDVGYISGPGTKHGRVGWALGGLMGLGGRSRVAHAVKRVERKFREGDSVIDVVGFSRGAAIALHFVNEIAELGKLPGKKGEPVQPRVRFLGLWDTVAAFGIPKDLGFLKFQKINIGWKLALPPIVDRCFHALALDERRESFRPTRLAGAYEVWFRGVHSDIGGGNANLAHNDIALAWMLRKALKVGVPVDAALANSLTGNPNAKIGRNRDLQKDPFRPFLRTDWMHYTISLRNEPDVCQNPHPSCPIETPVHERNRVRLVI